MNFEEWRELVLTQNEIKESVERLKVIDIIARMKSNIGSTKQWATELENALGIEELTVTKRV